MAISKVISPLAPYQQWTTASGLVQGDILGVEESLGHPAQHVSIEAVGTDAIVAFNVGQKIFMNHEARGNSAFLGPYAAAWTSPYMVDEKEIPRPNITVQAGTVFSLDHEFPVVDMKVVVCSGLLRITAT